VAQCVPLDKDQKTLIHESPAISTLHGTSGHLRVTGSFWRDEEKLFRYMLWYGILGVINRNNIELYIYDFDYNISRLQAEARTQDDEPLYAFNPAIHIALQTKGPQSGPLLTPAH
jgi:hypothetical protein